MIGYVLSSRLSILVVIWTICLATSILGIASEKPLTLPIDFDEAIKTSQLEHRPLLVVFGADWCGWCRKFENELVSEEAADIRERWVIVKVDVDKEPSIADEMKATALPSLRVLGMERAVVASSEGYMPIAELQTWLEASLPAADPALHKVLYSTEAPIASEISKLIEFLGHRSANIRNAAQTRLASAPADCASPVVDALRVGRLSQQLCALQILKHWKAPIESIDPWQPATLSENAIELLIQWLRKELDVDREKMPEKSDISELDPATASAFISRLLSATTEQRDGVMSEAVQTGGALLPAVRTRLANATALADIERTVLRELLYRLLAGPKTRLENGALLNAMARLNAETHRAAADKLLESVTSQDQPLVDELSEDIDPLVRELSVSKLQLLGALQDGDRLRRLLGDKNPSIRTAVLRELSANPKDKSIETLIEYISRETDEDLLVFATKTLGQLGSQAGAEAALCRLATNASWRVRAAAMDAVGQLLEKNTMNVDPFGSSSNFSSEIEETVVKAAEDSDAFVAKKAIEFLPKIVSTQSAEAILHLFQKHPDRFVAFEEGVDKSLCESLFAPLIEQAGLWLESNDEQKFSIAIQVLSKWKPTRLRDKLVVLLESKEPFTRIAALRVCVASFAALRDEELAAIPKRQPPIGDEAESSRKPWFTVPESFRSIPKSTSKETEVHLDSQDLKPELTSASSKKSDSLSFLDSFFGDSKEAPPLPQPEQKDATPNSEIVTKESKIIDLKTKEFDLADSLFGKVEVWPLGKEKAETNSTSFDSMKLSDPSKTPAMWLADWQSKQLNRKRAQWIKKIRESLQTQSKKESFDSKDAKTLEDAWLHIALLASGFCDYVDRDYANRMLSIHTDSDTDDATQQRRLGPSISDMLPWLSAESRVAAVKSDRFDWTKFSEPAESEYLNAATVIEDLKLAELILEEITKNSPKDSDLGSARRFLLRALIGAEAKDLPPRIDFGDLRTTIFFTQFDTELPGTQAAIDWLTQRRQKATGDFEKALLLATLSFLDHPMAVQSAIGLIAEATNSNLEIQVALAIALADTPEQSVDRAVHWLEHPLRRVQTMSVKRLVATATEFAHEMIQEGIVVIQDDRNDRPGFCEIQRELPIQELENLPQFDPKIAWQIKLLLIAGGSSQFATKSQAEGAESPIAALFNTMLVSNKEQNATIFLMAAALAKAGRTDAEAMAFYTDASEKLSSYGEPASLYRLLKTLDGEEIQQLRREMLQQHGAEALSP